jgi:hypothetical protein
VKNQFFLKILFLFFVVETSLGYAEIRIEWSKTYNDMSAAKAIHITREGNFLFVSEDNGGILVKIDNIGNVKWKRLYWDGCLFNSLDITTDNKYTLCGSHTHGEEERERADAYILKTDSNGNMLWEHRLGWGYHGYGYYFYAKDITQTTDGHYAYCGSAQSSDDGMIYKYYGIIAQYTEDGDFLSYSENENCFPVSICSASNGDIVACGGSIIYCVNESGHQVWEKVIGQGYSADIENHIVSQDGGFLLVGSSYSTYPMLLKTDKDGNQEWIKRYDFFYPNRAYILDINQASNGDLILCGKVKESSGSDYDAFLMRTSRTGKVIWTETFGENSNNEIFEALDLINDNSFVVSGEDNNQGLVLKVYDDLDIDQPDLIDPVPSKIGVGSSAWFQWSSVGNATSYDIQIDSDWDFSSPLVDETYVNGTRFFVEDMKYSHTYNWRVRSRDGSDVSDWSESRQFTTMAPTCVEIYKPDDAVLSYLEEGDCYYIDKTYPLTTIPEELSGCLWIKTANGDKDDTSLDYITLTNTCPSVVYVGYDWRATQVPAWLSNNFTDTGLQVAVYDDTYFLNIWEKAYSAGQVVLGGNMASPAAGALSNYVVFLKIDPALTISGAINYFQSNNPVPSVEMQFMPDSVIQNSDANGLYRLENLQAGIDYIVTPRNEAETLNGSSVITSQDAYEAAQIAMGNSTPSSYQSVIADVDGDGRILMWDASLVARYSAGIQLDDSIKVGDWQFDPEQRSYPNLQQSHENQDYTAFVMGDVDGSWQIQTNLQKSDNLQALSCFQDGNKITIPVSLSSSSQLESFDLTVNYDPTNLIYEGLTLSENNFYMTANNGSGYVRLAAFRNSITESGRLESVQLEFRNTATDARQSDVAIDRFLINGKRRNACLARVDLESDPIRPSSFSIYHNYPNPFNPQTTITFDVPWDKSEQTTLNIFDIRGAIVRNLCDDQLSAGSYTFVWDGKDAARNDLPSGLYLCQLRSGTMSEIIKLVKTK